MVSVGIGALAFHNAYADAKDQSLQVGRQLADMADLMQNVTAVRINNQPIYLSTATTDEPVSTVLDRFQAHCNRSPAFGEMKWRDLANLKGREMIPAEKKDISNIGVMRREDPASGDGVVMCFTRDGKAGSVPFMDAMRDFAKTGDLAQVGGLNYVHVEKAKSGHTIVQTVWTEGSFNLRDVAQTTDHDSPGSDPAMLPRPENSVRQFTAEAIGAPYAARIYHSTDAPDVALKAYDKAMDARGWLVIDSPIRDQDAQLGRWYAHEGLQAMVSVKPDGSGSQVLVGQIGTAEKPPKATAGE